MFVKVIKRYNDTVLEASLPVGVILEVDAARAAKLLDAKVCEEFTFTKKGKEAKKVEEPVKEEQPPKKEIPPFVKKLFGKK